MIIRILIKSLILLAVFGLINRFLMPYSAGAGIILMIVTAYEVLFKLQFNKETIVDKIEEHD